MIKDRGAVFYRLPEETENGEGNERQKYRCG